MDLFWRSIMELKWVARQSAHYLRMRRAGWVLAAGLLVLAMTLSDCGQTFSPGNTHGVSPSVSQGATPTAMASSSTLVTTQNPTIDATVDGLHIQGGFDCGQAAVFGSARLNYDTAEIQQMKAYFGTDPTSGSGSLPATLQFVSPGLRLQFFFGGPGCGADLQMTNTGTSAIEVLRAGVKLISAPVPNTYQYHFIDFCSLGTLTPCPPPIGGTPRCGTYLADVSLATSTAGALADAAPVPEPATDRDGTPCPANRPLNPGDSIEVLVRLTSTGSAGNLIYRVAPALTVQTASGQQMLTLPGAQGTLVFANPNQYSCYKLQGTTFTLEAQGEQALGIGQTSWCV